MYQCEAEKKKRKKKKQKEEKKRGEGLEWLESLRGGVGKRVLEVIDIIGKRWGGRERGLEC